MAFYAVYILSSDGRMLFGDLFRSDMSISKDILSSGLIKEISTIHLKLGSSADDIEYLDKVDNITYYMKKYGDISVSIVSDLIDEPQHITDRVAWNFLRNFGETDFLDPNHQERTSIEVSSLIKNIIEKHSEIHLMVSREEVKILTPVVIFDLPPEIQDTAISVLSFTRATVAEIANDLMLDETTVKRNLETLAEMGYISKNFEDGQPIFEISYTTDN